MLVVSADLLGLARIEAAAESAGSEVTRVDATGVADALGAGSFDLVVVDLDSGRVAALDALDALRDSGRLSARVVAFVSHVDEELADSARERGYETLARGRFWRTLGELFGQG